MKLAHCGVAIELPDAVVTLLQFIGVDWPNVNEDKVREFASHVRDFAQKIDDTHKDSTGCPAPLPVPVRETASHDCRSRTTPRVTSPRRPRPGGQTGGTARLYRDRDPCDFCRNSMAGYGRWSDVDCLRVYGPNGLHGTCTRGGECVLA
ncbi:hypothetical protein [Streptomyces noursei]|uniref:hypothetical protein n=1 Tax=Streptomyces noursei TaxID=1971 RepID=UPI0030F29AD5